MVEQPEIAWVPGERDYKIGLRSGKVVCQNPKGQTLASLPKWLKESESAESLRALAEWLDEHRSECMHAVERWMLRSLPIPRDVLQEVWPDADWRECLENLVVAPVNAQGEPDFENAGLLRAVESKRGVGVIDLDGETQWHKSTGMMVLHPILIADLTELRELASDLAITQIIDQLYRPINQPTAAQQNLKSIDDYAGGVFEQLNFALSQCRRLGYPVRGGYATCRIWERNTMTEARYYVGDEYPEAETYTGQLVFVDAGQQAVKISELGAVTFSEGVRMAAAIYAKRKVEESSVEST